MNDTSGKLHLNKLGAAQRQLRAAIRMFFHGEDELAIHTVAAAAYRIVRDLKEKRGCDEAADHYLRTFFYVIRDYRRGTLPKYFTEDPDTMKWIREAAEKLPIEESTSIKELTASVSPAVAQAFRKQQNKYANFLKHADRDHQSTIAIDDLDNLTLLMQTLSAYVDLKVDDMGPEGFVFWIYYSVSSGMTEGLSPSFQDIGRKLETLPPSERLDLCSGLIEELKNES